MNSFNLICIFVIITRGFPVSSLKIYVNEKQFTWNSAKAICAGTPGQLLVLDNIAKVNKMISEDDLSTNSPVRTGTYWIGLYTDSNTCDSYRWLNGNQFNDTLEWSAAQPKDCVRRQCVQMAGFKLETGDCKTDKAASLCDIETDNNQISTLTTTLQSVTANTSAHCVCCPKKNVTFTEKELDMLMTELKTNLSVSKRSTSLFRRRMTSVYDSRHSSVVMGTLSGAIMALLIGCIILSDTARLFAFLCACCRRARKGNKMSPEESHQNTLSIQ